MSSIVIPGPFAQLVSDPREMGMVATLFEQTLWKSFAEDAARDRRPAAPTQYEIKRRFAICEKWFRIFRGDFRWGTKHALEVLPVALRAELDGTPLDPGTMRTMWAVPDSAKEYVRDPSAEIK